MKLHILASGKKAKGIQLERLTQRILEHIGYEYVNTNKIGAGGDEIDVDAKYVLPQPVDNSVYRVICECKAHEKPITIDDWDKFIGKVYKYDRNGLTMGLMIALSDANGNVKGDIEEHKNKYEGKIKLITGKDLIKSLSDAYGLENIEVAKEEVNHLTNDTITNVDIVLYNEEVYWIFSFANDTFSVFDKKYNSLSIKLENELLPLLSEKTQFSKTQYRNIRKEIDIIIRRNVVKVVSSWKLMHGICSFKDLIDAVAFFTYANIVPNEKDIEEGLSDLQYVNINCTDKTIKLKKDDEVDFILFYKTLFAGQFPYYLYHNYYKEHINDSLLDKICLIQYNLQLTQDERDKCLFLLKNSPSALCYALNQDLILKNNELKYDRISQSAKNHFIEKLLFNFENDCNTNIKGFVFEKLGVRDVKRNISVNIVDNSGFETTINAQKRLFYLHAQDSNSGVVCMALDDFEGKYNKETDSVEPTSYHDNSRYEHLGTII